MTTQGRTDQALALVREFRNHAARLRGLGIDTLDMQRSTRKRDTFYHHTGAMNRAREELSALGLPEVGSVLAKERRLLDEARLDDMGYQARAKQKRRDARACNRRIRELIRGGLPKAGL